MTIIIAILMLFDYSTSHAENEAGLANYIEQICMYQNDTISVDQEDCMLYYVNCAVGKGGKWTDKVLLKCVKERKWHSER